MSHFTEGVHLCESRVVWKVIQAAIDNQLNRFEDMKRMIQVVETNPSRQTPLIQLLNDWKLELIMLRNMLQKYTERKEAEESCD